MADSIISYEDLIGQDDTFDVIFQNIDQLKKELVELAQMQKSQLGLINPNDEEAVRSATKEVEGLTSAMKKLEVEETKAQKTKKKSNDLTNEELIQREKQKLANRERIQVAKQMAILQSKETGEIEKLRAKLSLTTISWKKLSKEELKNGKEGKKLIKTKKALTNQLKKLEKQTGDNRRNVGNYTKGLGKLGKVAAGVFIGRGIGQAIRNIGRAIGNLIEKNKEANPEIGKMGQHIDNLKASFSDAGKNMLISLAPAINWLLEKLGLIPAIFSGIVAGAKQLGINMKAGFTKLANSIGILFLKIEQYNPFSDRSTAQIEANIKKLQKANKKLSQSQKSVGDAFKEGYDAQVKQTEAAQKSAAIEKKREASAKRRAENIKKQNDLLKKQAKLQKDIDARIKAIASL